MAQLGGRVPEEFVLGTTPDISVYALFDWYTIGTQLLHFLMRRNALVNGLELMKLALISWPALYSQTPAKLSYVSLYGAFQTKNNNLTQPNLQ